MADTIIFESAIELTPITLDITAPGLGSILADRNFTVGTGSRTIQTAQGFTGGNLSYALNGPLGVTINSTNGVITVPLTVPISGPVTVTASNGEGSVAQTFQLTVLGIASIGALTPAESAPVPFMAPDGIYHDGTLTVLNNELTIAPGQTPAPGVIDIDGTSLEIVADRYDATTDVELLTAMGQGNATLDGTTVHMRNGDFSRLTISNLVAPSGFRIETAVGSASIDGLLVNGGSTNLTISCLIQLRAWPATHDGIRFSSGLFTNTVVEDFTIRHGYGPSNENITFAAYPEYTKVRHVETATTVTTVYQINWQDPTATSGQVFIFNESGGNAWYAIGDETVTATVGATANDDSYIDPGSAYTRQIGLNPTVDTHFAVITDVGTTDIDLSAEIGLAHYMADGITNDGAATFDGFIVRRGVFEDLANACAINAGVGELVRFDLQFWRIYQDWMKVGGGNQIGPMHTARIIGDVPFALGGITDPLTDAGDPHADADQYFAPITNPGGFRDVIVADLTVLPNVRSATAYAQGIFGGVQGTEGYVNFFVIGVTFPFATTRGLSLGYDVFEQGSSWLYAYGNTFAGSDFATDGNIYVYDNEPEGHNYLGHNLAANRINDPGNLPLIEENNEYFGAAASPTEVFPNWADRLTAADRDQLIAAVTPTGIYAGKGVDTLATAIDRDTDDPKQVVRWANLPPGIGWRPVGNAPANALYTFDAKKVMAGPATMDVVPGAGTEVQVLDIDGSTVVTAWTASATTIQRGQFLQKRRTSGAANITVNASMTVNGFTIATAITSANDVFFTTDDAGGTADPTHFVDPNATGANIRAVEFQAKLTIPSIVANMNFGTISGNQLFIEHLATAMRIRVRDSAGTTILLGVVQDAQGDNVTFPVGVPGELEVFVDLPNRQAIVTIDGVQHPTLTLDANTGTFQTTRFFTMLAEFNGTDHLPVGTVVEYAEWYKDTGSGLTLHKPIAGLPAAINDPSETWHQGADAV